MSSSPQPVPRPLRLEAFGRTDRGRVRPDNEDAFAVDIDAGLLVVADGIGGHAAGEIASRTAVDTVTEAFVGPRVVDASAPPPSARGLLTSAIEHANACIFAAAQQSEALEGMGTTIVAALAFGGRVVIAHVGDSRAYLLRGRRLTLLTVDHTIENELPRCVDPRALRLRPGMLTRAVGTHESARVETRFVEPHAGDVLLLCSDGLTNAVGDDEIAGILLEGAALNVAADRLIARANENGGPDNVTVVLARWSDRGSAQARS